MKSMIGTTVPRLGAVAALTVLALAGSPSVLAQPATPTGITLTCPEHQWSFDLRSGECIALGNRPLKRWPAQVADGRLRACW